MGYAKIVSGGENGRYTIELDFGKAQRDANVLLYATVINRLQAAIVVTQNQIAASNAKIQEKRDLYDAAVAAYIAAAETLRLTGRLPPGSPTLDTKAIDVLAAQIRQAVAAADPLRRQLDAQRVLLKQAYIDAARWNSTDVTSTRGAWCTTLKEDAPPGSYVATCEIPGDSSLVLIAPECRGWLPGDGTITPEEKAAQLGRLGAQLTRLQAELATKAAEITAAVAKEVAYTAEVAATQATYIANDTPDNYVAMVAAQRKLTDKKNELAVLRQRHTATAVRILETQRDITAWSAKATSATPRYGDGILRARAAMSPEQSFWTAAVQPGWQKYMPTYRWGTATGINYENDTMTVALFDQRSSVRSLSVNQASTLKDVPVEYMSCNAQAFEVDDRVVVEFQGQDWKKPRVIGFLDNPKPCRGWDLISVTQYDEGISEHPNTGRQWVFRCTDRVFGLQALAARDAHTLTVRYRLNRGEWLAQTDTPPSTDEYYIMTGVKRHGRCFLSNGGGFGTSNPEDALVGFQLTTFSSGANPEFGSLAAGTIVEARFFTGTKLWANVAIKHGAAPAYLARTKGKILATNADRLVYPLYEDTGN